MVIQENRYLSRCQVWIAAIFTKFYQMVVR